MRRILVLACLCLALASQAFGQSRYGASIFVQATAPATTSPLGTLWWDNTANALSVLTNTGWVAVDKLSVPAGTTTFVTSGSCATGWTEITALNGRMLRGTVAANGNVGTTGGSDTYTPAGTVAAPTISWPAGVPTFAGVSGVVPAQTFTGSSATSSAVSAGTPAGTNAAITAGTPAGTVSALTTGADSSTTGGVAKAIAQTPTFTGAALATHTHVFTGAALATHTHTLTATGTNGTVNFTPAGSIVWPVGVPTSSAPALTGTQATVVPAYTNVIFCTKN